MLLLKFPCSEFQEKLSAYVYPHKRLTHAHSLTHPGARSRAACDLPALPADSAGSNYVETSQRSVLYDLL